MEGRSETVDHLGSGDGMARQEKYETHVKPHLDRIEAMCRTMTEEQIADTLGISISAWKRYKKKYEPLRTRLKKGKKELVIDLRAALIKKALGYEYKVRKTKKERNEDGKLVVVESLEFTKHAAPDVAAINLLLKNYDKENWSNDPQMLELRQKEIDLQTRKLEQNEW